MQNNVLQVSGHPVVSAKNKPQLTRAEPKKIQQRALHYEADRTSIHSTNPVHESQNVKLATIIIKPTNR